MAGETVITIVGNLVDEVELKFTQSGVPMAKFRVASTPRQLNKQTGEWTDGETLFLPVTVWRQAAENVAESLQKGTRVVVMGALKQRSYDDKEGTKRTVFELDAEEIAVSLKSATAAVTKRTGSGAQGGGWNGGQGSGQGGGQGYGGGGQQQGQQWPQQAHQQPARAPQGAGAGRGSWGGHSGAQGDEPPF